MPGRRSGLCAQVFLLLFALLALVPAVASAALIDVDFTGRVALISFPGESGADVPVSVGDPVVGRWSYDTEAASIPFGTDQLFINPTTGFSFTIDVDALTLDYDGQTGGMTISGAYRDSRNFFVADHTFSGTTGSITGTEFASSITYDATLRPNWVPSTAGMSFTNTFDEPPLPEILTGVSWILQYRSWTGPTSGTGGLIYIEAESVRFSGGNQIPEPATLALVGLGLVALRAARRRR